MIPTVDNAHVTEALGLLTSMFKGRPITEGLLSVYVRQVQKWENAAWVVINARKIDGAASIGGVVLDAIGSIVGEPRLQRDDVHYQNAIKVRVLINRSTGRVPEVLQIVNLLAAGATWDYHDAYPATFHVLFGGAVAALNVLASIINQIRPAGVGARVLYTGGLFTNLVRPSSSTGGTTRARGPASSTGGSGTAGFSHVVEV